MKYQISLFLHLVLVHVFIRAFFGCVYTSLLLTIGVLAIVKYYRIKPPSAEAVGLLIPKDTKITIAHRGAGFDAPENTIAAVRHAKKNGATAVEFDVEYTLDGVAVVFHDDTLDRCTDGTGSINCKTLQHVQQLNASAKHQDVGLFPNERMPTLEEMIQECLDNDLLMFIDVKSNAAKSTEVLVDLYRRFPALYRKAIVCSFNPMVVYSVRKTDPNIICGLTHRSHYLSRKVNGVEKTGPIYQKFMFPILDIILKWSHHGWLWYLCGNSFFLSNLGDVSATTVEHFRQRGIETIVWTVNNPTDRNYFLKSLNCSIISDTMNEEGCVPQAN